MKISTAMNLGSSMIFPIAGKHLNEDRSGGCAWGMVNIAAPAEYHLMNQRAQRMSVFLPCGCVGPMIGPGMATRFIPNGDKENLIYAVIHLFNDHVMTRKDWSMEKLIDWVASVEPPDPLEQLKDWSMTHPEHVKEREEELVCP